MFLFPVVSVSSVTSAASIRHDPDLLKADIALAQNRLSRLRRELVEFKDHVKQNEAGYKSLQQ